jgi:hypothetical protein
VRRSEENTSRRLTVPNNVGDRRGREDPVLSDDEFRNAVSGREFDNLLDHLGGVVASVTTDDEGCVLRTSRDGGEDRLEEVLGVVFLLEDGNAVGGYCQYSESGGGERRGNEPLAETRGTRPERGEEGNSVSTVASGRSCF